MILYVSMRATTLALSVIPDEFFPLRAYPVGGRVRDINLSPECDPVRLPVGMLPKFKCFSVCRTNEDKDGDDPFLKGVAIDAALGDEVYMFEGRFDFGLLVTMEILVRLPLAPFSATPAVLLGSSPPHIRTRTPPETLSEAYHLVVWGKRPCTLQYPCPISKSVDRVECNVTRSELLASIRDIQADCHPRTGFEPDIKYLNYWRLTPDGELKTGRNPNPRQILWGPGQLGHTPLPR
ncbi:hypothetical protein BJ170DRAFT_413245 [Xylariales sp. AK1849]|nr:hypothetical protein BJ170DRAFT_413245 [Xylariales sp. AK1849]